MRDEIQHECTYFRPSASFIKLTAVYLIFFQFVYKEVCWRFMSMDYKEGVCIVAR